MEEDVQVKKGQLWQTGPTSRRGSSRTVKVTYVWTASRRVSVTDEDTLRHSSMSLSTLFKSYTCVKEAE